MLRPAHALFVLLPASLPLEALLLGLPDRLRDELGRLQRRLSAPARDAEHLAFQLRSSRTPLATTWLAGMGKAMVAGAVLGGIVNGVLASSFGMLGGLLEIAIPLGVLSGAFMACMAASMRGTETVRPELLALLADAPGGTVLAAWIGSDEPALRELRRHCDDRRLPCVLVSR